MMRWARLAGKGKRFPVVAVVLGLLAVGLIGAAPSDASTPALVALGDSYTSGEGVKPYEPASEASRCDRSTKAYPAVAASTLGISWRSAACSGATVSSLTTSFKGQAPQVSSVRGARYVVLTIGGNDIDALALAASRSTTMLTEALDELRPKVAAGLRSVRAAAPGATVLLVGYPDIFPKDQATLDRCIGPLSAAVDVAHLHHAVVELDARLASAAHEAGVRYLDVAGAFAGHTLCSDESYAIGLSAASWGRASFHPNALGQQRIGRLVAAALQAHAAPTPAASAASTSTSTTPVMARVAAAGSSSTTTSIVPVTSTTAAPVPATTTPASALVPGSPGDLPRTGDDVLYGKLALGCGLTGMGLALVWVRLGLRDARLRRS